METTATGEDGQPAGAGSNAVEIQLNGEPRTVPGGTTVAGLLEALDVDGRRVAVERNRRIVPRDERAETALEAGDVVEIVQFVGGGR